MRFGCDRDEPAAIGAAGEQPSIAAVLSLEDDLGPVTGPDRFAIELWTGHDGLGDARHGIRREDVTAVGVGHEPGPGKSERRRHVRGPAHGDGDHRNEQREKGKSKPDLSPRQSRHRDGLTSDVNHGKPPFKEGPGRSLARPGGLSEETVAVRGHRAHVEVVKEGRQFLLEASVGSHADCPPGIVAAAG